MFNRMVADGNQCKFMYKGPRKYTSLIIIVMHKI